MTIRAKMSYEGRSPNVHVKEFFESLPLAAILKQTPVQNFAQSIMSMPSFGMSPLRFITH